VDEIRKVDLRMNENAKYKIIKKLVDSNGNKRRAAIELNCTVRHINRMIIGYKEKGKNFFIHGNRGVKPAHALPDDTRQTIVDLYRTKYEDSNLTHFSELLKDFEGITVSSNTVRSILLQEFILSPKANRVTKKTLQAKLIDMGKSTKSKEKANIIQSSILAIEEAHPRRPRCAYFGEMLQMDASVHLWFGESKSQLHIAVDDSTGAIVGAYFDAQETLNGYYHVLEQILKTYGIPYMFYTDRRTVFEYKQKRSPSIEEDTFTQFGYACKQLGIDIKTTSVPQAKGRVERMFQTLQSRLPIELRLAGVGTLEQANEFLNSYIKKFNAQFALPLDNIKSVFETQPSIEKINLTLGVLAGRKVDNGSCVKYNKGYYLPVDAKGHPVYYHKGTCGIVIKAFNNKLYFCVNEKVYALELLPEHVPSSRNFDLALIPKSPKKRYIPPMNHPWRKASFEVYCNKQAHRQKEA